MRTLQLNVFPFGKTRVEVGDEKRKHFSDITYNGIVYKGSREDKVYYKEGDYEITQDKGLVRRGTHTVRTVDGELFVSKNGLIRTADTRVWYKTTENLFYENGLYATTEDYFVRLREEQERRRAEEAERALTSPYGVNQPRFADLSDDAQICVGIEIERGGYLTKKETEAFSQWKIYGDTGGEYCTPILDIDKAVEYLSREEFAPIFNFKAQEGIGGHIHLSNKKYEDIEEFYNAICHYRPILWAIYPERARCHRCYKNSHPSEKYSDVHIGYEYNTVEFRIFPSLNSLEQAKFRIGLLKFFATNPCSTKQECLDIINEKSVEFLAILDIVYDTLKKKQEILSRIIEAFEVEPQTKTKVLKYLNEQCERLGK